MDLLIRWFLGLLICWSNFLSVDLYFDPSISWSHIWSSFWSDYLSFYRFWSVYPILICWYVDLFIYWSLGIAFDILMFADAVGTRSPPETLHRQTPSTPSMRKVDVGGETGEKSINMFILVAKEHILCTFYVSIV